MKCIGLSYDGLAGQTKSCVPAMSDYEILILVDEKGDILTT